MGAYIVKIDMQTGKAGRPLKNACGALPSRLLSEPGEREVCGKPGRHLVAGVWLCVGHHGAFEGEVRRLAEELAAEEDRHLVPQDKCVFLSRVFAEGPSELCGEEAAGQIGTAWACRRHIREAMEWMRAREQAAGLEAAYAADARRKAEMATWAARGSQVVYYLRRPSDGAIKIGTSTVFFRRHRNLARQFGEELEVLLTHCGAHEREHEIHQRFANLRIEGEWFRPGAELLTWIINIRRKRINAETAAPGIVPLSVIRKLLATAKAAGSIPA
jgi:hypothetical protein